MSLGNREKPSMKEMPLTHGLVALVDDEDFDKLSVRKWHAAKSNTGWYAKAKINGKIVRMHRIICPEFHKIDHKNRNTLDNRKENLRPCTNSLNQGNQGLKKNKTSRFKGVCWENNKWLSSITNFGKTKTLGRFRSERLAAIAYDFAAQQVFGEFACTNQMMGLL